MRARDLGCLLLALRLALERRRLIFGEEIRLLPRHHLGDVVHIGEPCPECLRGQLLDLPGDDVESVGVDATLLDPLAILLAGLSLLLRTLAAGSVARADVEDRLFELQPLLVIDLVGV